MRTLGFACQIIEDDESRIKDGRLTNAELTFLGIAAISDPIREDVPEAVKMSTGTGIGITIVRHTGNSQGNRSTNRFVARKRTGSAPPYRSGIFIYER